MIGITTSDVCCKPVNTLLPGVTMPAAPVPVPNCCTQVPCGAGAAPAPGGGGRGGIAGAGQQPRAAAHPCRRAGDRTRAGEARKGAAAHFSMSYSGGLSALLSTPPKHASMSSALLRFPCSSNPTPPCMSIAPPTSMPLHCRVAVLNRGCSAWTLHNMLFGCACTRATSQA